VRLGHRFNNHILQCLLTYIKKLPEKEGHRIIIVGTTSDQHIIEDLGLWECFNLKSNIPVLEAKRGEIKNALTKYLPSYAAEISAMDMNKDFKLPMKSLNFIADSLKIKLRIEKNVDFSQEFFDLYGQISGL
jgi:hypothetical protein